jgi:hypothetical protein
MSHNWYAFEYMLTMVFEIAHNWYAFEYMLTMVFEIASIGGLQPIP